MKAEAFLFELALKRPFSTSRHTTDKSRNLLIRLEQDGAAGVGEAASRGLKLTGDNHRLNAAVIPDLLAALNGHELRAEDPQGALAEVERIYAELEGIARLNAAPSDKWKPFRGLLSGFDIALLDLAAKRLGITVSELLGEARDTFGPTASTCSTTLSGTGMQLRFLKQAQRFSAYRCKGDGDIEANMRRLDAMRAANSASGRNLAFWLDLNEALPRDRAPDFIERLVAWMGQHPSPEQELILEQPVKKRFVRTLCAMQKQADETLPRSAGRIRLMADESLWDADDFRRLRRAGGVAAVNIKVPKAGGLRPALALARTVHKTAPETLVYLGGMVGTSDITGRALYNVALTFPRIDHCTAFPAENLTGNPATRRLVESSEGGVRRIDLGDGAGIGTDIDLDALAAFQVARYSAGGQASVDYVRDESTGANVYAPSPLLALTQHELDSHLMEREALLMGFSTVRTSPRQFEMRDAEGGSVSFYWTVVRRLPETTRDICKRKYESKLRFMKNSVPVAEGRLFETGEIEAASAYARGLGWPVVVKPGIGTGGVGVSANIRSDKELAQAFEVIRTGEKVRSRNDGTMIVERHVDGTELRVFVADGRVVGAVRKLGVHVVGDGQKTIKALVDEKNARRRSNPRLANTRIRLGNVACAQLARQELTPDSVPAEGRTVSLSTVASISQGADMVGVLDEVHPTVLDAAVRAAGSIPHLRTCGLDIIVPDHTAPLESDKACVCEANISPSIAAAHFPVYGQPVSVAKAFVESVARARKLTPGEAGADVAVTISLSLPSVPDDALTKRLAAYFRQNGMAGGLATEDGKVTIWARGTPLACCALPAILSGMPGDDAKSRRIESVIVRMSDSRWEEKCGTFATDFSKVALPRPEGPLFWRRARNLAGRAVRRAARMVRPARRR